MNKTWWLLALAITARGGFAQASANGPAIEINHCAGGPPITVGAADARALLDDDERDALLVEMRSRFPVLERDGFAPPVILLWRKASNESLYVSLRPNTLANNTLCFTATFVAPLFRITPTLAGKYFSQATVAPAAQSRP